jgi:hypothetical protein
MLHILEAMGVLALLTRQIPREIADEQERIQETFDVQQRFSEATQQKMLGYIHELELRLSALPQPKPAFLTRRIEYVIFAHANWILQYLLSTFTIHEGQGCTKLQELPDMTKNATLHKLIILWHL